VEVLTDASTRVTHKAGDDVRTLLTRDYVGFKQVSGNPERWIELPGPDVTLILNFAAPFGGFPQQFVAGLTDSFTFVERHAGVCCIDVKLSPLSAFTVLGVPMYELSHSVNDVRSVIPSEATFFDSLRNETEWQSRFKAVDTFLARRAAMGPRPSARVAWPWQRLVVSRGRTRIGLLADEVGWTGKHLIKMFKEQVGVRPKTISRVLRFRSMVLSLDRPAVASWAEIAAAYGYSDQSHLIRDFKRFAGQSPSEYLRSVRHNRAPKVASR